MKFSPTFTDKGDFEFTSFMIFGAPNQTYEFFIKMNGRFTLSRSLSIKIRLCEIGEYYNLILETCLMCPYGTFSLKSPLQLSLKNSSQNSLDNYSQNSSNDSLNNLLESQFIQQNVSICEQCPPDAICKGSKIVPSENHWISTNLNSTFIVKCPLESCLYQDLNTFQHEVPCAIGYKGPLCIRCDEGFAKDSFGSKCLECKENPTYYGIFFGKLLFMLFFVTYQVI